MKFEVFRSPKNKKFYFRLKARNGQTILASEGYSNKAGVKNGIKSVQKNCSNDNCFERKVAKNGKHHFNLLSTNKKIVGSSQMYASKSSMEAGIRSVKRVAPQATVVEVDA
ncbi:MAG: YegP family protein [Saprospiraceae bacterium]|nr:YegP family protein [Saprospiraceae bacterium]